MRLIYYVATAGIAAIVAFALSMVIWKLSNKYRLYPKIRERDVHTRPTPRLGGVAMFLGVAVAFAVGSPASAAARSSTRSRCTSGGCWVPR